MWIAISNKAECSIVRRLRARKSRRQRALCRGSFPARGSSRFKAVPVPRARKDFFAVFLPQVLPAAGLAREGCHASRGLGRRIAVFAGKTRVFGMSPRRVPSGLQELSRLRHSNKTVGSLGSVAVREWALRQLVGARPDAADAMILYSYLDHPSGVPWICLHPSLPSLSSGSCGR